MKLKWKGFSLLLIFLLILSACSSGTGGKKAEVTEIDFYFPVAVGGPVARIVDDLVADFEGENPDVKVNANFGGSYAETMTQVMASVQAGNPPEMAVLFSIDLLLCLKMMSLKK
ncbi:hypothetical protein ACI2OX_02325 [Bacillus sp. N9]